MSAKVNKLSARAVANTKTPGLYSDGGGLYLQASRTATKSWVFRYKVDGRSRYMGLGSLTMVSLAQAREFAADCRRLRLQNIDPIEHRNLMRMAGRLDAAKAMTFDDARDAYIAAHRSGWRNVKHQAQWASTLTTYATPVFGKLPVQTIDVALVMKVLEPIWSTKPETASRLRGRIERILDWAKARGFRSGENPARWRGHLDQLLPARSKVWRVKHHSALPFGEVASFMYGLRERDGVAARALEFAILTATRTGEVLGATWDEVDLRTRTWTIPAHRMKDEREHRVPLSDDAIRLLEYMQTLKSNELVFPGHRRGRPLSNMALLMVLRRMERWELTAHGFRSTFRTWAAERTAFQREVVEAALAQGSSGKHRSSVQPVLCLHGRERGAPATWDDQSGEFTKNTAHLIALRLLEGWLKCKSIVHTSMNRKVVKEAQEHEDLYYTDIKRLLRLLRGEKAIQEDDERTEKAEPEAAPDDDNTVLDVLKTIRALQEKGASEEEWEFVLTKQQAKLRAAIKARTHPDGGVDEKDQKFVILEEAISNALKEGKRPEL